MWEGDFNGEQQVWEGDWSMEFITRRMHIIYTHENLKEQSTFKKVLLKKKKRIPFGYIIVININNRAIRFLSETKDGTNHD